MQNNKFTLTHKHLTLVFTGVVFAIVVIVGFSFLTAKYVNENRNQKREITSQVSSMVQGMKSDEDFFTKYARQKTINEIRKFRPWDIRRNQNNSWPKLSFFMLDSENNLVFKEILQEPKFDEINFESTWIYSDNETYIYTSNIWNSRVVFYQNVRYSWEDVLRDILLLIFLAGILSWFVYFIWYRFVGKALIPVKQNIQDMSDFTHNAGHELKTPLAVLRWNLQIMLAEKKYDTHLIDSSIKTIDNTDKLIEWLRDISQVWKAWEIQRINLPAFIREILADYIKPMKEKNITLELLLPKLSYVQANRQELEIFLKNIIKNAITYNKKGWKVMIKLEKNILTIIDTGIGIASENLERVFDRLFRESSVRDTTGHGIGLSLVKRIAETNGWKISLKSEKDAWSRFEVIF